MWSDSYACMNYILQQTAALQLSPTAGPADAADVRIPDVGRRLVHRAIFGHNLQLTHLCSRVPENGLAEGCV